MAKRRESEPRAQARAQAPAPSLPAVPGATYRLQLNREFTLKQALAALDYLHALGVTDLYLSPVFKTRPGSAHGYDVVDHDRVNPDIGTEADFFRLSDAARRRGMRLLLDVVPNHMCVTDAANRWWMDVLENGQSSVFARYFDIDWNPPKPDIHGKVLFPVLGDQFGRVLEAKEIQVAFSGGAFSAVYGALSLPLTPKSWRVPLDAALERLKNRRGEAPATREIESVLEALARLPSRTDTETSKVRQRMDMKDELARRLDALHRSSAGFRAALAEALAELNGVKGQPRSFDRLEALLAKQAYRLCFWRVAANEVNYRRFFDINEMAAIRVEDPEVFAMVHHRVLRWIAEGRVQGLRIDHVDGLADPHAYLSNLETACRRLHRDVYLVVEKILGANERLDESWPVRGTTGYDFANLLNGLFVDPAARRSFARLYERLTGVGGSFAELTAVCKKLVMLVSLSSEVYMLALRLDRISEQHRWSRDFTLDMLHFALREVIARFPVYRAYVQPGQRVSPDDRRRIVQAVSEAARRNPATDASVFEFIREVLLLEEPEGLGDADRAERHEFVRRFQQVTGPIMAKGLEDTAFYRQFPLASLNEVGGDPAAFGTSLEAFHRANVERARLWPHALSATSTHDSKRSEDVRARIDVLSEMPNEWYAVVLRWRDMNARHRTVVDGEPAPGPNEEYLLYQTLVGSWPVGPLDAAGREAYTERVQGYMVKALREAKQRTSWLKPHDAYEAAVTRFTAAVIADEPDNRFVGEFEHFLEPVISAGMMNALSQTLFKLAAPGVPDLYQGCETWAFTLVDPDNRRPVDFAALRERLESLKPQDGEGEAGLAAALLEAPEDGRIKQFVTARALALRGRLREVFDAGEYLPLRPRGPERSSLCAFLRRKSGKAVIAAGARFFLRLGSRERRSFAVGRETWEGTEIPVPGAGAWRDAFTGREVRARQTFQGWALDAAEVFAALPVALLERTS